MTTASWSGITSANWCIFSDTPRRSVVLNLEGDSYRLREHHARGEALRAATTGTRQPLR